MTQQSNKNKNRPNLRFPGFEGAWEEKRLNHLCKINPKSISRPDRFIYIDLESVSNGILLKEETISENEAPSRAQRVLFKNDILFQTVRPYQKNNLYFDYEGKYVASTGYAQLRTKNDPHFIFQYLHTTRFVDKVIKRCTGTSYPAISSTDLGQIQVNYPKLEEQKKIASFLTLLDARIHTQSKIIEDYKLLKKGFIQKVFNQEICFNENYSQWTKCVLGNLITKTGKKNSKNLQLPIYSINNKEGFLPQNEQFDGMDSNERGYDISLYKIINKNTFAYNPARINVGSIGFSGDLDNIIISSLYVCFKTNENLNNMYLKQYLETFQFNKDVLRFSEGGVRQYLFLENFSKIKIPLPCLEEQQKIAKTLSAIDSKITLETNILEQYQEQKKYLLQNLFI